MKTAIYRNFIDIAIITALSWGCATTKEPSTLAALKTQYDAAILDSKIVEPAEIYNKLIAISPTNKALQWQTDAAGQPRVLVVTWTAFAGYKNQIGQETTTYQELWVTAVPELKTFCQNITLDKTDLTLRLNQLMGLPPDADKTYLVEMWVAPNALFRPSPDPEIEDQTAELDFPDTKQDSLRTTHRVWFENLKAVAYNPNGYPWTRLGYTYDWGNQYSEVGLSEFVIRSGAKITIKNVYDAVEYGHK